MNPPHRFPIAAFALTATLLQPAFAQTPAASSQPAQATTQSQQPTPTYTPAAPHPFGTVANLTVLQQQAATGDPDAEFQLGEAYWTGQSVPRNLDLARQWVDKAAAAGDLEAQIYYGVALYTGYNIPKDHTRAAHYLLLAADHTPADPVASLAQYYVASMYRQGDGLPQSIPQAIHYYQLAIASGSAAAAYDLGMLYFNGTGVHTDKDAACDLFQQAGEEAHIPAIVALASCYELGQGRVKDRSRALDLYKIAGSAGDATASAKAATLYATHNKLPDAYAWLRISQSEGNLTAQPELDHLKASLNPVQLSAANATFDQWRTQHPHSNP
jgi:TPR repeat protein